MSLLTQPLKIKNTVLSNRLVMPPMATAKSGENGTVTTELCDYYKEKSQGGDIGFIMTEHSYVSLTGKASPNQLSIACDEDIDGLKKLVSVIHQNGSKAFAQINHAGGVAVGGNTGCEKLSASSIQLPNARPNTPALPKEMADSDIQNVIQEFAQSARRAKLAGFDGVEIHSAHGYLLNQFYSPLTNKRTDSYTGSTLEGRIKLHLEIINAVRETAGTDFPIAVRLGACDYADGGSSIQDSVKASKAFEEAGVSLLDISGGFCGYTNPTSQEQGYFSEITREIKKHVSIPVILTGGITSAAAADELLENKSADWIGVGRALLKDSLWAEKAIHTLQSSMIN